MKKEVGYIILCQCYPFVRGRRTHFILLRRLLSKPIPIRRMIEGRITKITGFLRRQWCIIQKKMVHYDSMKFQCFYSGKDDSINSMEEGMNYSVKEMSVDLSYDIKSYLAKKPFSDNNLRRGIKNSQGDNKPKGDI